MKFIGWMKKNWVNIAALLVALLGGADVVAGVKAGKALTNVAVIPSLAGVLGAVGTMLFRWINTRTVTTRAASEGLDSATLSLLESLFVVASHPDVTQEMVANLADMAAASVVGHATRVRAARLSDRVTVLPADRIDVASLREALGIVPVSGVQV